MPKIKHYMYMQVCCSCVVVIVSYPSDDSIIREQSLGLHTECVSDLGKGGMGPELSSDVEGGTVV